MQFVIFLSALLASFSGLVAGERQPVRAQEQVQASAMAELMQPVLAVAESGAKALAAIPASPLASSGDEPLRSNSIAPSARTRLTLKQSWLI